MAEKRLSKDFKSKLLQLLDDPEERELLYRALHDYQQVRSVRSLVSQLKEITTTPERLILYDEIRPFIVPKHQAEYDKIIPRPPSERTRIIRLVRNPGSEGLGFKFVGGVEFGVGVFVCDVFPKSQAEKKGLKVGDEIIRINGYSINQATHSEALAAMKLHKTLMLKVKSVGMFPVKTRAFDEVSWKLATKKQNDNPAASTKKNYVEKDRKVFANLEPGMKLGCGIGTGSDGQPGIFVHKLSPGSMAEHLGFKIGDQVIDVNGESFLDITHSEAVVILKSSRQLTVTLRSKEFNSGGTTSIESEPPSFRSGSMGIGMGGSRPSAYDIEEKEKQRRKEEMIKREEEERMGSVMMSGNWTITPPPPKPQEPEPEEEDEEEEEEEEPEPIPRQPVVNRFAAIAKEEDAKERERREKEGIYVPTTTDKNSWWNSNPATLFTKRQIDNREMRKIEIPKVGSLDIELEGGFGTPLGGKLVVSEVFAGGAAARSGELNRGDQIMMVEGKTFIDINRQIAEKFLEKCMESSEGHGKLRMIIAVAPIKAYEDEVTFF